MPDSEKLGAKPGAEPRARLQRSAAVIALAACIAWVHAPTLTGSAHLTAHHDNLDGAAPLRIEAARQWRSGQLPRWNPWKRTGMPLLADTTAGAIYPGNIPFLFVDSGEARAESPAPSPGATDAASGPRASQDSPVFRAMDQVAALHALLAGVFMFVFLSAIQVSAPAAVLGGLLFACSGTMGWFAAWYIQIQNSAVWLPLILAAVHKTAPRLTPGWLTIGAAAVALQFFAGYPETSFYSAVIAIGYAASRIERGRRWQPLAAVASIYAAGLALAAVQLLPSLELQLLARRPGTMPLEVFQSLPASASMLWHWLVLSQPSGFEFPPPAAYHFGAAAVLAAALGLLGFTRRTAFFVLVLVIGFVLSIGAATPVSGWLHEVPGFQAFRHPFKHLFEVSFAMAALAALGADKLSPLRSRMAMAVVVVTIVATSASLRANQAVLNAVNPASVDTSGARPDVLDHVEPGWRVLTPRHFFQKRDPSFLLGDYPSQFAVPAVHGAGPFLWNPLAEATGMVEEETTYRRGLFEARDRTLALLSCRYLVQTKQGDKFTPALDPAAWNIAASTHEARLMERKDALPRLRFVHAARCADEATVASTLRSGSSASTGLPGSTDPARLALVDCSQGDRAFDAFSDPASLAVRVIDERAGRMELSAEVPMGGRGFLVVSQADYPGWKASIDGAATTIHRVHGLVQGIEVPAGTSRLVLSYEPWSLRLGALVSATLLFVLMLLNLVVRIRGQREPAQGVSRSS